MAQLQKGTTYITGDQVTAANLNALVDSGILTPGAVTDQTAKTVPLAADTILLHSAADTALRKTTMTQLFATPQPLGATTPSSVAATTGTFSSTLGVTGVATLGNGAILGTPASGTVTNLTGTASININGTVGATTAAAGSFTTLAASGAFTNTQARTKASLTSSTGTNDVTISLTNTGGRLDLGRENSAGTEFGLPAYSSALYSGGAYDLYLGANGVPTAVKITSTGLNSTAIGASTPSTGAFTTLSATDTISLTKSTNGVTAISVSNVNAGTSTFAAYYLSNSSGANRANFGITGGSYTSVVGWDVQDAVTISNLTVGGISIVSRAGGASSIRNYIGDGTAAITTVSSTGLAVTGTLSATGQISTSATGNALNISTAGATALYQNIGNSAGNIELGAITTGEAYVASGGNKDLRFYRYGSLMASITSTGLAVTGNLTSSSYISSTNIVEDTGVGTTDGVTSNGVELNISRSSNAMLNLRRRSSDGAIVVFRRDTTQVGTISVTTTATAYNTSSDARLKTNVRELTGSGAVIDSLQPRIFDWKTGEKDTYGFIAQEAFTAFPQAVTKGDDDPEVVTQQWAIDASKFMPLAIAELQSLRKRLAALESK